MARGVEDSQFNTIKFRWSPLECFFCKSITFIAIDKFRDPPLNVFAQHIHLCTFIFRAFTTVFVDTRHWKTKHRRKGFQNFRQSCVLLTHRIEIHQLQPLVWPSNLLYVMLSGCDRWISIRSVNNTQDWRKFWKRFRGCFVFQSRVSTKTVVMPTAMSEFE